jgi:DNA-binding response OmpR family regulator
MAEFVEGSVLVVDDDYDAGQNLGDILSDLGYGVHVSTDPFVALEIAHSYNFEIALLDLKMPGMDGLSLARKLKELCNSTIVLLTTAYADRETLQLARSHGIWRVFPKPLDIQRIIPSLAEIIRQPLVLLIEDDADQCHSLTDVLQDQGYRVCFATDIERAMSLLRGTKFHLVLIDMKLPDGFGDEVYQKVRGVSKKARVVMITGYRTEMQDRIESSLKAGADAVCYKPFQILELLEILKQLTSVNSEHGTGN